MLCKLCNTRIRPGGSACPNCGSHSFVDTSRSNSEISSPLPLPKMPDDSKLQSLEDPEPLELDENEVSGSGASGAKELEVGPGASGEGKVKSKRPMEVELNEPAEVGRSGSGTSAGSSGSEEKEEPPAVKAAVQRGGGLGSLDADGLRALLAEKPDLLEPGLTVYKNDKGRQLGVSYTSAVGEIDLLARDASGNFVVVMCADRQDAEQLVSSTLQRIGWVRKHLASSGQQVRAVVLLDRARDDIAYAAAAVTGTVSFRIYRVAVTFDELSF